MSIISTNGAPNDGQDDGDDESEPVVIPLTPHLQLSTSGWRIGFAGDVSATFGYGEPGEVVIEGRRFIAYVNLPDEESDETFSEFEHWLYEATPVECGDPVDVEFDDEEPETEMETEEGDAK